MSLTSYDPNLSKNSSTSPPKLIPFQTIESILQSLLQNSPDKIFSSQKRAFQLATQQSKSQGITSSLPIQTAGQPPQPTLKAGDKSQLCLKTGYVSNDKTLVTKIAANGSQGNTGIVFILDQLTLRLKCILCDEGLLTEVRTAGACVYASQFIVGTERLKNVTKIGIVGGGVQAIWNLRFLSSIVTTKKVVVKTTSRESAERFMNTMKQSTFAPDREWEFEHYDKGEKFTKCQLIHTVTPSRSPVLSCDDIDLDTFVHITAIGSDSPGKCELDMKLIKKADLLVCDNIDQSKERGEFQRIGNDLSLFEIGALSDRDLEAKRGNLTIFDSSGVAFQDVEMANLVSSQIDIE